MSEKNRGCAALVAVAFACLGWPAAGTAATAAEPEPPVEVAVPFEPRPLPPSLYGIRPPADDPVRQRHLVPASYDGADLFVEVWLPETKGGGVPPARLPTVLSFQPYTDVGVISGDHRAIVDNLVSRGYAYAQAHVRGTNASGGCWDYHGEADRADVGDVIAFVGSAGWSDGNVGLYGISSPGGSAVLAAALADEAKTSPLKTIVAGAPVVTFYERFVGLGGVPYFTPTPASYHGATAPLLVDGLASRGDGGVLERASCWPDLLTGTATKGGAFTDYAAEREIRRGSGTIDVPVLMTQGFADRSVHAGSQIGLFEMIPPATRKVALYGLFGHEWPDGDGWDDLDAGQTDPGDQKVKTDPAYTRADWQAMVVAWFDQYLKDIDSGVDEWPTVQVQDTDGQWRSENDWPTTDARPGRLALGPHRTLGARNPTGSTSYVEGAYRNSNLPGEFAPGTSARFVLQTGGRLEMMGQPVADLWVEVDRPDANIAVRLDAFDAAGAPIAYASTSGFRSMRYLDPYVDGRFEQRTPKPPVVGQPVRVIVPLQPRDVVVPAGGSLVLTVAGSVPSWREGLESAGSPDGFHEPSQVSGAATRVTVLHDCVHTSVLRFEMPAERRRLLNVREDREIDQRLSAAVVPDQPSDAGGVAVRPACSTTPARARTAR